MSDGQWMEYISLWLVLIIIGNAKKINKLWDASCVVSLKEKVNIHMSASECSTES
jgi:hypothetical protein